MTPEQVELVQRSFAKVIPRVDDFAVCFYTRLLEIAPSADPKIADEMEARASRLMPVLAKIVAGLNDPESINEDMRRLALHHVRQGVPVEHYVHIGAAFIWALHETLGDAFPPEVQEAWLAMLQLIFPTMIGAGRQTDRRPIVRKERGTDVKMSAHAK